MIGCPRCGEKLRYAPTYSTAETYWRCQRCGYDSRDCPDLHMSFCQKHGCECSCHKASEERT